MIPRHPWGGLADPDATAPARVAVLGLPYDGAACWRPGAALAPRRLREISNTSPAVSEEGFVIDAATLPVRDLGDVAPESVPGASVTQSGQEAYFAKVQGIVRDAFTSAERRGREPFLLSLGGDHSVTIPLVRGFAEALGEPFGVVLLDAHPDLFDVYDDSPLSNACPMRRALDTGLLSARHLVILGTRSYNPIELDFMRENGIRFVPAREIDRRGVDAVVATAGERLDGVRHVYLTLDIDVADPSCAPGTGAPVAGGLSSRQVLDLTRGLVEALPVRAMDMVEIAPPLDPTDATLFLGLQVVFETFAVLARKAAAGDGSAPRRR
jgi:agmatinase